MQDFESLSQYRVDGRKPEELRTIHAEIGLSSFSSFNGSARLKQGLSEVLCFVEGPKNVN